MTLVERVRPERVDFGDGYVTDAAYTCDNCGRMSVVTWWSSYDPTDSYRSGEPESYDRVRWSPPPGAWRTFEDVPEPIASAASEAWFAYSAGAHRGALALARAVVEAAAKENGATSGNLAAKIDALAEAEKIRKATRDAAHEIRHIGNEVAHGDLTANISPEEAEEVLVLMDEVLVELFQAGARLERARAARLRRKSSHK